MAGGIPVNPWRAALLALVVASASCMKAAPEPVYAPIPAVPSSEIEQVVFLVGDAGVGTLETSPLVVRLAEEVERWSGDLGREDAVSVVFLGDNVYPEGIRPVGNPLRVQDSLRLHAQVAALAGPDARLFVKMLRNRMFPAFAPYVVVVGAGFLVYGVSY